MSDAQRSSTAPTREARLARLVDPARTAVVTMELQRGVVGDLATLPELRDVVDASGLTHAAARLCRAARKAGARVVHCTAEFRPDGAGSARNCRLLALSLDLNGAKLVPGAAASELVAGLAGYPSDIVIPRCHGLTPFTSTALDQILRNCGISTVVAVGCSLNVGLVGMVLSAVDLGYQVVVPRDAVVGVPLEYGEAVIANTVALLATLGTVDEIIAGWPQPAG